MTDYGHFIKKNNLILHWWFSIAVWAVIVYTDWWWWSHSSCKQTSREVPSCWLHIVYWYVFSLDFVIWQQLLYDDFHCCKLTDNTHLSHLTIRVYCFCHLLCPSRVTGKSSLKLNTKLPRVVFQNYVYSCHY